jgi:hypothetical protein
MQIDSGGETLAIFVEGFQQSSLSQDSMQNATEKQLDKAFESEVRNSAEFVAWFLTRTKFSSKKAKYHWSRSNHPWGPVSISVPNTKTGQNEQIVRECETDILVVLEDIEAHTRFALHIENKLENGKFTLLQPELYHERAKQWLGNPKYEGYTDYEVMLIAPQRYYDRCPKECAKFDRFVSHEDISRYLPAFSCA